ncbi:hypothetical protein HGRIS_013588 [Hohenbuehelia grisea]|uniref:Uncharacterized protein n=1 Tax=Hohenbuehelia grisea TaxID=104357 RepID=A0ABR3IW15_9AGAR
MHGDYSNHLHYIEVMCNSALYGVYAVLIVVVVWLLWTRPTMLLIHKIMFWAGILMFLITTVELGLVIQQVTSHEVPLMNARAQVALMMIQFMIGDSILIWRVWVVWNRSWRATILPIALMLGAAGARVPIIVSTSAVREFVSDISSILILANVGLCTILIGGRIWYLQHQISKSMTSPMHRTYKAVLLLIIESGSLIFISQILAILLSKIDNDGVHTILDMQVPLIGMLPTLIVLLVHLDVVPGSRAAEEVVTVGRIEFRRDTHITRMTTVSLDADVELGNTKVELEEWRSASRSPPSLAAPQPLPPSAQ